MDNTFGVTFTGVTETDSKEELLWLGKAFPSIEYGVLYSEKEQGKGRYAGLGFIKPFGEFCADNNINASIHICGRLALQRLITNPRVFGEYFKYGYKRMQINFNATEQDHSKLLLAIRALLSFYPNNKIITQHNENNQTLWYKLFDSPNYQVLWDSSCGRGKPADEIKSLFHMEGRQGYAGGINSRNVVSVAKAVNSVTQDWNFWLDMESSLRTLEDDFSIVEAEAVCQNLSTLFESNIINLVS